MQLTNSAKLSGAPRVNGQAYAAFRSLSGAARTDFESLGEEKRYRRGDRVFSEGDSALSVFFLLDGRMKVSVTSREGRTFILRIAEGGQLMGLSAALLGSEYEATAEAHEPCRIIEIPALEFKRFLARFPEAAMEATRWSLQEYRMVFNDICRLTLPSTVAGRLASLLLNWLKGRHESGQTNSKLILSLTHEEIADMAGTSRETVSRTLQQFQRENLISIKGASLTVLQPEALEQLAI